MKYIIKDKPIITCPSKAVAVFTSLLDTEDAIDKDKEHFWVMHLSSRHAVKCVELVSLGIIDRTIVAPREVFVRAVRERSTGIIICHNHPSGTAEPSEDDIAVTRKLIEAGKLLDIPVLDHIIITAEGKHQSLKEWGLTEFYSNNATKLHNIGL